MWRHAQAFENEVIDHFCGTGGMLMVITLLHAAAEFFVALSILIVVVRLLR